MAVGGPQLTLDVQRLTIDLSKCFMGWWNDNSFGVVEDELVGQCKNEGELKHDLQTNCQVSEDTLFKQWCRASLYLSENHDLMQKNAPFQTSRSSTSGLASSDLNNETIRWDLLGSTEKFKNLIINKSRKWRTPWMEAWKCYQN